MNKTRRNIDKNVCSFSFSQFLNFSFSHSLNFSPLVMIMIRGQRRPMPV